MCAPDIKVDTVDGQEVETVFGSPTCLIHFKEEEGPLICFTETSFRKFLTSHEQWITLDGQQQEIAERTNGTVKCIRNLNQPLHEIQTLYYHRQCYSKFTNVTLIKRAQSRCSKKTTAVEAENGNIQNATSETSLPQKKIMRSDKSNSNKSRNKDVLQPVCLMCQKKDAYITDQLSILVVCSFNHFHSFASPLVHLL